MPEGDVNTGQDPSAEIEKHIMLNDLVLHGWRNPPTLRKVFTKMTLRTPCVTYLPPQGAANPLQDYLMQPLHAAMVVRTLGNVRKAARSPQPLTG